MAPNARVALVWGAGGHGRVVADLVRAAGWCLAGFVDGDAGKIGQVVEPGGGRAIMMEEGFRAEVRQGRLPEGVDAIVLGIGDNTVRARCLRELEGIEAPFLVHPTASVSDSADLGRATVVLPLAVINAGARIGCAGIINSGAIVEHNCTLGEAVHIAPRAVLSGDVTVADRSWIGVGATVIQGLRIGADVVVGAGAVVVRDIPEGLTVVGNPARPLRRSDFTLDAS